MKITKTQNFSLTDIKKLLTGQLVKEFNLKKPPKLVVHAHRADKVDHSTEMAVATFKQGVKTVTVDMTVDDARVAVRRTLNMKDVQQIAICTKDASVNEGQYKDTAEKFTGLLVTFKP